MKVSGAWGALLGLAACGGGPPSPGIVQSPASPLEAGEASKSGETMAATEEDAASKAGGTGGRADAAPNGLALAGSFEDHGACISRATDWKTVERWAESLEVPEGLRLDGPVETALSKDREVGGKVEGRAVSFYTQTLRARMDNQVRHIVATETGEGLAACAVHDELLHFGYLQSPTPVRESLRAFPGGGFSYLAHHEWNGAALGDEHELDWEIRCLVRDHKLGCVAATTKRVDRRKDYDTGKTSEVVREAKLVWRGDVLDWIRDGKTVTTELTPGSAKNIDWIGQPVTIEVKTAPAP